MQCCFRHGPCGVWVSAALVARKCRETCLGLLLHLLMQTWRCARTTQDKGNRRGILVSYCRYKRRDLGRAPEVLRSNAVQPSSLIGRPWVAYYVIYRSVVGVKGQTAPVAGAGGARAHRVGAASRLTGRATAPPSLPLRNKVSPPMSSGGKTTQPAPPAAQRRRDGPVRARRVLATVTTAGHCRHELHAHAEALGFGAPAGPYSSRFFCCQSATNECRLLRRIQASWSRLASGRATLPRVAPTKTWRL